ncbi:putative reverse transcriptase domain-containing protein [Tanacetum coccineum]
MTDAQIRALISQGVADALVERDADKSRNGDDNHDSGTGVRRQAPVARECTYSDFLKCQPLNFKVTRQIKFATCTLQENALTWWNSHVKTIGHDVAYAMTWKALKKMMTDKYCPRGEIKKLEIKLWNLKVKGSVMASKPKKMQDAIEFATELMDQKIRTIAERQAKNNRKFDDTSRNNQNHQQPFKRHNVAHAYTTGPREKKPYGGSKPLCPKCNYHHDRQCATKCANCKRTGHLTRDCKINNQRFPGVNQRVLTCFECGAQGHFKSNCPKLKNKNQGNQAGMVMLSLVSTAFSSLIDIIPATLDYGYDVELVDGKIIAINTLIRGCTLNFLNHPFNIDLMPVELGSFNVIIGMDWLSRYHAVINCAEKIILFAERMSYLLAHVTTKKAEDKSEEKRLKDVPIVRDFPEVFPEDLPGIPPTRQVEFQIDLKPSAAPVARSPYRLTPFEMKSCRINCKKSSTKAGELQSYLSRRRMDHSGCASITEN